MQAGEVDITRVPVARDGEIDDRGQEQREDARDTQPAENHPADRLARFGTSAAGEDQRQGAQHGRDQRHHDRPQADRGGFLHRFADAAPLVPQLVSEFDDQDAVLRHQPDQHHQPDLRIDVQRDPRQEQREYCRGKREGNGQQHHQCAGNAFELRHQHQEHDHQREDIGQQQIARRFLEARRIALQQHVDPRSQRFLAQPLDLVDRIAQRRTGCNIRGDLDCTPLFGAVEFGGDALLFDHGDAGQRDQRPARPADVEIAQVRRIGDTHGLSGEEDRDCLVADVEIHQIVAADHRAQRLRQIVQLDAEIRSALAIDLYR